MLCSCCVEVMAHWAGLEREDRLGCTQAACLPAGLSPHLPLLLSLFAAAGGRRGHPSSGERPGPVHCVRGCSIRGAGGRQS